jgi:hypothetical protein
MSASSTGCRPGDERPVIDVDGFVGEVHGNDKQGAGYGYTGKLGYHPSSRPAPPPTRCFTSERLVVLAHRAASVASGI